MTTDALTCTDVRCPVCGNRLGRWFGDTFVMHHRGRVVRAEGSVTIGCEDCGTQTELTPPVELEAEAE